MESFYNWFEFSTGLSQEVITKIIKTMIVVVVMVILNRVIVFFALRRVDDAFTHYRWRKSIDYFIFFVAFIIIGSIWISEFKALLTFFGLLSAGIAIALKDPITDLAGWLFIIWRKPFEVGDRIQIGDHAGDVIDVRIFKFTILEIGNWVDADQSTGRLMHIPNSQVFSEVMANYTSGFNFIWHETSVMVTFESNWEKAKSILTEILDTHVTPHAEEAKKNIKEVGKKYLIHYKNFTPIVYTSVRESGIKLTMRFLCDPRRRRFFEQIIMEDVLRRFAACADISFAYPTQRFFNNQQEGKPGTRIYPDND